MRRISPLLPLINNFKPQKGCIIMKSLPFKLFVSIFIAFAIACTQFSISAQFASKEEAQSALYMIANTTSQSLDKVSNPQAQIDELSYDGKNLTIVISTII